MTSVAAYVRQTLVNSNRGSLTVAAFWLFFLGDVEVVLLLRCSLCVVAGCVMTAISHLYIASDLVAVTCCSDHWCFDSSDVEMKLYNNRA